MIDSPRETTKYTKHTKEDKKQNEKKKTEGASFLLFFPISFLSFFRVFRVFRGLSSLFPSQLRRRREIPWGHHGVLRDERHRLRPLRLRALRKLGAVERAGLADHVRLQIDHRLDQLFGPRRAAGE